MDDNVCCPDTSFLVSLLDNSDNNHNIAVEEFRKARFGDIYILQPVMLEYLRVTCKEYEKIINYAIDEIENSNSPSFRIQEINNFINIGKEKLKRNNLISNIKKIENMTLKIHEDIKIYYHRSRGNLNHNDIELKIAKKQIINYLYDCREKFKFNIISIISIFKDLGHRDFITNKESYDKINSNIYGCLKFQNSGDNIILTQFVLFALSNPESNFILYLFDKEFAKIGKEFIENLKCQNAEIKLIGN